MEFGIELRGLPKSFVSHVNLDVAQQRDTEGKPGTGVPSALGEQ